MHAGVNLRTRELKRTNEEPQGRNQPFRKGREPG